MTSVILVCGGVPVVSHCLPPLILRNSSLIGLTDGERRNSQYESIRQTVFHGGSHLVSTSALSDPITGVKGPVSDPITQTTFRGGQGGGRRRRRQLIRPLNR